MGDVTEVILEVHDQGLHDLVDNARLTEIIQNAFLNVGLLKSRINVKKWLFYKITIKVCAGNARISTAVSK